MARLAEAENDWARRIRERRPYGLVFELRTPEERERKEELDETVRAAGIDTLWLRAAHVLSRYAQSPAKLARNPLYVHDPQRGLDGEHTRIDQITDLFDRYEKHRTIERLYVPAERRDDARGILVGF
jgi:hypothetical protein